VRLVRWVESDGKLRTDEQIINEMMKLLPFRRRGRRIEQRIRKAIEDVRLDE
jgi:hypothetical protein